MAQVAVQIVILFSIVAVGYLAKKLHVMDAELDRKLSKLILSTALPAMILGSVLGASELPGFESILLAFGLACLCYLVLIVVALVVVAALRIHPGHRGVFRFMCVFGNVGFIGFPMLQAIFGPEALIYGSVFNLPFNLLVFTVGAWFLTQDNETGAKVKVNVRTFLTPTIVACLSAVVLALLGVHAVPIVGDALNALGAMTAPAALLVVGSSLAAIPARELVGGPRLWICALVRLVGAPLVVWALFRPFVPDPMMLAILVVIAGMPVATNGTMLCYQYGGDTKTMAQGTFISTVAAIATIPLLVMLVG